MHTIINDAAPDKHPSPFFGYSLLNVLAGFTAPAFNVWKPTDKNAINTKEK